MRSSWSRRKPERGACCALPPRPAAVAQRQDSPVAQNPQSACDEYQSARWKEDACLFDAKHLVTALQLGQRVLNLRIAQISHPRTRSTSSSSFTFTKTNSKLINNPTNLYMVTVKQRLEQLDLNQGLIAYTGSNNHRSATTSPHSVSNRWKTNSNPKPEHIHSVTYPAAEAIRQWLDRQGRRCGCQADPTT
jgi:hypothetical protein